MKTNKLCQATAYVMALTCGAVGLVGCSSDDDAPVLSNKTDISLNIDIPTTASRAYWEYNTDYKVSQVLGLNWSDDDTEIAVVQGGDVTKGSIERESSDNSAKVKFQGDEDKSVCLIFPYSANPMAMTIESTHTQNGETTSHLSNEMYMYASVSAVDIKNNQAVHLNHAPAILRFLVKNKRSSSVSNVSVSATGKFCLAASIDDDLQFKTDEAMATEVAVNSNVSLEPNGMINLYTLCFPTETTGTDYVFTITIDGKSYKSNVISGSSIANNSFKAGYYYTFCLALDDQLTATVGTPTISGWGSAEDETDL